MASSVPRTAAARYADLPMVKEREAQGYAYEGADAEFELLARKMLGGVPEFFRVDLVPLHGRAPLRRTTANWRRCRRRS